MMAWDKKMNDYNLLTLLRIDSSRGYEEDNTTVGKMKSCLFSVPRIQFYCIEIARLREGHSNNIST